MPTSLTNPVAEFRLEPDPHDPAGVEAVATFVGEDGQHVEMRFTRTDAAGVLAARSFRCAMDLQAARATGTVVGEPPAGEVPADGEPLSVSEYLQFHQVRTHFDDPAGGPVP